MVYGFQLKYNFSPFTPHRHVLAAQHSFTLHLSCACAQYKTRCKFTSFFYTNACLCVAVVSTCCVIRYVYLPNGWRSEVRGQRSKVKGRRSKVEGQRSKVKGLRSKAKGRRSKVEGQRSKFKGQRSKVEGQKSKAMALACHLDESSPSPLLKIFEIICGNLLTFCLYGVREIWSFFWKALKGQSTTGGGESPR